MEMEETGQKSQIFAKVATAVAAILALLGLYIVFMADPAASDVGFGLNYPSLKWLMLVLVISVILAGILWR